MLKKYPPLWLFLAILALSSCKKTDPDPETNVKEMKNLQVSSTFNWETSRDVTFLISSEFSSVVTITSEDGDIQFYRGFFNRLTDLFHVKLNIPARFTKVRVNGIPVTISGDVATVSLSNGLKSAHNGHPKEIPTLGLIAAWHFDENAGTTANDAAGDHHGVINNAMWTSGIRGSALEFDGSVSSHVRMANGGLFNPVGNNISFSFWFRLNAVGNNGTFIFQNVKYIVNLDAQGKITFALYTPDWKAVNSGVSNRVLDTDWHHVAMTYDGSEMKIYLDGLQRTSTPNTGDLRSSTSDVYIGKQTTSKPFTGIIDEMLMYERALTETEILQIYGSTPDPGSGENALVSYWNLNENTGTIANDSLGGNNGTITGASWGEGISGSCLVFNGTTGAVRAPSKLNLNPVYGITMMAWAKTTENKTAKIFQKGDWDGHGLGQGNWDGWDARIMLSDNTEHSIDWGGGLPILNEWYHLAMTYDGQQLKLYVNGQLRNSLAVTGLLKVNNRDLSIGSDNNLQKWFNGSIDELKFFNQALDATEIQTNYIHTGNSPDTDGDGVPDEDDAYPEDPARAFNNYSPADGFGTLAFEDLWPGTGDYDFNDLVIDYRFKTITNANNKVSDIVVTFIIRAIGAGLQNGFGFQLPGNGIPETDVEVAGFRLTESYINLNENGTEAGQEKITVVVFDNVNKIMPSSGFGVNVEPGAPYLTPDTTMVTVSFKSNTYSMDDIAMDRFNPFLIINLDRGKEVHLPDNPPTSLVDLAWFKTGNDDSDPASGRYYKTQKNLPWAIRISSGFDYTIEKAQITSAYLKFVAWAESSGTQYPDWYLNNSGYRNESNIYQVP